MKKQSVVTVFLLAAVTIFSLAGVSEAAKQTVRLAGIFPPDYYVMKAYYLSLIHISFKKAQILALMLIEEKTLSKDKICEYLWADKTMDKARRNLSNALSHIKKFCL